MIVAGRELRFGENEEQRILRPAWTQDNPHNSYDHQYGRKIVKFFYKKSKGLYKIWAKTVANKGNKGRTN